MGREGNNAEDKGEQGTVTTSGVEARCRVSSKMQCRPETSCPRGSDPGSLVEIPDHSTDFLNQNFLRGRVKKSAYFKKRSLTLAEF